MLQAELFWIVRHLVVTTTAGAEVRATRLDALKRRLEDADELTVGRHFDEFFAECERKHDSVVRTVGCGTAVQRDVKADDFVIAHVCPI